MTLEEAIKQLEECKKELNEYKKQVFKLGDAVYWYDDDYRFLESTVKRIEILESGTYEYSTQDIDFTTEDIGDWVFKNKELREFHFL